MRFLSAISFLCAAGAFFLPWLDVRCEMGSQQMSFATQTGYDIATGKFSEGQGMHEQPQARKENKETTNVPLLLVYVGMLAAGVLVSVAAPRTSWRVAALLCAVIAGGIVGFQYYRGFPIEEEAKKAFEENKNQAPKANLVGGQIVPNAEPTLKIRYMPGFYLACALTVLPILCVFVDMLVAKPATAVPGQAGQTPGSPSPPASP
jgi:hypothetical protein